MTTIYRFPVLYTKAGVATSPSSSPTVQVVDSANNILVAALTATTAITNMPGAYYYAYTGADNLTCWALFHTSDTSVDQQDIASYTPLLTVSDNAAIADAVWDEVLTPHTTTDSAGETLTNISEGGGADPSAIATSVWASATRTLTSVPTIGADVWAYPQRTLTQFLGFTVDTLSFYNYNTNVLTISDVTDDAQIWFTVKQSRHDADSASIIQISKTGGLLYLNGAALVSPITSTDGSLSVTGGNLIVTLSAAASALLNPTSSLVGDVKTKTSGGIVSIVYEFDTKVVQSVTRAV